MRRMALFHNICGLLPVTQRKADTGSDKGSADKPADTFSYLPLYKERDNLLTA